MTEQIPAHDLQQRIETELAHLWMVRTFLKHAPEFEENLERMQIPRTIFDFVRAVETRVAAGDDELRKMIRKKLPKLKAVAEQLAREQNEMSSHTNFQMAVVSLGGCVSGLERIVRAGCASPAPTAPAGP